MNDVHDKQREALRKMTDWAAMAREVLGPLLDTHRGRVHFRPTSTGVTMVGLALDRPQRGRRFKDLRALCRDFDMHYAERCANVEQGRPTPEKSLQSFLIGNAYEHGRSMKPLEDAARRAGRSVDLIFVADEVALPANLNGGKCVFDLLVLNRASGRSTPVLIELKTERALKQISMQLEQYSQLFNERGDLFARLYSAILGEEVTFDGPVEKWVVWPRARALTDPRASELAARGIQVCGYSKHDDTYEFRMEAAHSALY